MTKTEYPVLYRYAMRALATVLLLGLARAAPAQETSGEISSDAMPVWPESDTVLDLLHADAQAASTARRFRDASQWLAGNGQAEGRAALPGLDFSGEDQVEVLAIYGVGRALQADVSVNGTVWRYRHGRRWPLGVAGGDGHPGYGLQAIELPCVRLRKQEDLKVACLRLGDAHD